MYLFQGRLNRTDYAIGSLTLFIVCVALLVFGMFAFNLQLEALVYDPYFILVVAVALVGSLSLAIRRLHDLGYAGWWCLLQFVSIINLIFGIFLFVKAGDEVENKYGIAHSHRGNIRSIFLPSDSVI